MWEKILLALGFLTLVGYIFYRIFLIILIKNNILENKEGYKVDKHNLYALNVKEED
nr:hypothetical protein [uncultured Acinetobacter sp.]